MNKKLAINLSLLVGIMHSIGMSPIPSLAVETQNSASGTWSVSAGFGQAEVKWSFFNPNARVEVSESGESIANGGSSGVTSLPVTAGQEIMVVLAAHEPLSAAAAGNLSMTEKVPIAEVYQNYEHISVSNIQLVVPGLGQIGEVANAATLPDYSILRYQTFIPSISADAPFPACAPDLADYRFLGDNRSWGPGSSSYRTRFDARVNWIDAGSIIKTVSVGTTVRQKQVSGTWVFDAAKTATTSSMQLTITGAQNSQYVNFRIQQDVVNPLCNAAVTGGIYFDFQVSMYRSGAYLLAGTALRVPNHEIYVKDQDNLSWTILARRELTGFECLVPIVGGTSPCLNTDPV
ncbi:MAG: hypothetical protein RLZZ400_677, partial [Actinomycetota bacterium]